MTFVGGLPETRCGRGSTIENTESIRAVLPDLLSDLGVRKILDAPCGDCNWISTIDLGAEYTGVDYDYENLKLAQSRMFGTFIKGDIVMDDIPESDLMLCRDFFQHLPNDQVSKVLGKVRSKWLLATSHTNASNEELAVAGGFRPLNLCSHPFSLEAPLRSFPDGIGRILGLWKWA